MTNELMQAVLPFCSTVLTDVLPAISTTLPDVAAATMPSVAAATPEVLPHMEMTREIIEEVDRQLELLDRIRRQIKELYIGEGRPQVSCEREYHLMADFIFDEMISVRKYQMVLKSLERLGTGSPHYIKAMSEFFWTP